MVSGQSFHDRAALLTKSISPHVKVPNNNGAILPLELLTKVLHYGQIDYSPRPRHWNGDRCPGWLRYRRVCRWWWSAADNPQLWSNISISLGLIWVQFALSKVHGHPITLELNGCMLDKVPLTTFQNHRDQIVRLALTSFDQATWDHLLTVPFPNLEEVRFFESTTSGWSVLDAAWNDTCAPGSRIVSLALCTVYMSPEEMSRFKNLRSLSLSTRRMVFEGSHQYFRNTLPLLPYLETLRIITTISSKKLSTQLELKALLRLYISGSDLDIVNFLKDFKMPQVQEVDISVPGIWEGEELVDEREFCRMVEPYLCQSTRIIGRLEISDHVRKASTVKIISTSGSHILRMRLPIPSRSIITSASNLLDRLHVQGCRHLVLRAVAPSTLHEENEDWDQLLRRTTGLKKLSVSGYGDRWKQASILVGERVSYAESMSWQSLEEVEMRRGFWVKMQAARDWIDALWKRAEDGRRLPQLSVSQWEMQLSGAYRGEFQKVVRNLVWDVANPGRTEKSICPHVQQDSGQLCLS